MSENAARAIEIAGRLAANAGRVVLGKPGQIEIVVAALVCRGHVLFEDVPGTAKTMLARSLAASIDGAAVGRVQCTPDLQPTDVTGLSVWDPVSRTFEFQPGPIFVNVLVVDEINRALPKAQSALLEGMAERQVTVDGVTHPLADPFLLIATQNSIEQEGTFPLPEAQLDRFIVRTSLGYPSLESELTIVDAQLHGHPIDTLEPVVALDELPILFEAHEEVYIDPLLKRWSVELVRATRVIDLVDVGASVRGSLALERMARALALVLGRDYVVAEDIERLFPLVVMHRMVATADVIMEGLSGDELADRVWQACLAQAPRPEPTWDAEAATAEA